MTTHDTMRERLGRVASHYATATAPEAHLFVGDLYRILAEHAAALALLQEYAERGKDIAEPSATSLIGRTRALLARTASGYWT